jgi:hypothetical protein
VATWAGTVSLCSAEAAFQKYLYQPSGPRQTILLRLLASPEKVKTIQSSALMDRDDFSPTF